MRLFRGMNSVESGPCPDPVTREPRLVCATGGDFFEGAGEQLLHFSFENSTLNVVFLENHENNVEYRTLNDEFRSNLATGVS